MVEVELGNCEADLPRSIGYALRNWVARECHSYLDNVATYVCLTGFQKRGLIDEGFPADWIRFLWGHPSLCGRMGHAGRKKALREYSLEKHYERLMAVYAKAIRLGPPRRSKR